MRKESAIGKKQLNQVGTDARAVKASEEDFRSTNKALCEVLFQGKETLEFEDILKLKQDFKHDLWHYEFHTYGPDEKTGKITLESFLKSLTACIHGAKFERYLRRVKKVCE